MPIDVEKEETLTLTEATTQVPGRSSVHINTLHRWRLKGFRGVKLECIRIGIEWQTSREAIIRFIERLNPAQTVAEETPAARGRRNESAKQQLAAIGIKPRQKK